MAWLQWQFISLYFGSLPLVATTAVATTFYFCLASLLPLNVRQHFEYFWITCVFNYYYSIRLVFHSITVSINKCIFQKSYIMCHHVSYYHHIFITSSPTAKIHYNSFPVTSWWLPRSKSTTSPQHKRQIRNKLAHAKVQCVCCVVSFIKFHYNDLLLTCADLLTVSLTSPQQVGNFLIYMEVTGKHENIREIF